MRVGNAEFMLDSLSKFFNSLYIHGWYYDREDPLKAVTLRDGRQIEAVSSVGLPHGGVSTLGENLGFRFQSLRDTDQLDLNTQLTFEARSGKQTSVTLGDLSTDRRSVYPGVSLGQRFRQEMKDRGLRTLLDVGGRDRSKVDRSLEYPEMQCTVMDIIPSANVDVVGDAHEMGSIFAPASFDAAMSIAVFEHLAMPWRVAVEMNRVLKIGGIAFIYTHQTIGMHDRPWDFFRFSDSAWDSIFNKYTGYRIIERSLDSEQYVIPFIYHEAKRHAERAAGYEGSSVLVEKVSEAKVDWPVRLPDIISTHYPKD